MQEKEQKKAAKEFAEYWKGKGYEKGESQKFWISLLTKVYGVEDIENFIIFEDKVHLDHTSFIDGFIPSTHILIEQKGLGKDLRKGIRQSDGTLLTPFGQAKRYATELPYSQRPRWIITCNFSSFLIYDMENPNGEPEEILLENLEKEYYRLQFVVDREKSNIKKEMEVSIKAGEIVGKLYEAILPLYKDPENENTLKSLNALCVRLVFCLYAEDAGIFGKRLMFHDYLERFEEIDLRRALIDLFKVLDTKYEERDPYLTKELAQFPYVNGGLFADENIEIPTLTNEVKELILKKASEDFDWSEISPTIFGAVFESTLNPETRRKGGMHYTSIENIHKVIDPLFLDELRKELEEIKEITAIKTRNKKLKEYQEKISSLTFLDPACGSGNFLTETYLSLRKLENEVIYELTGGQIGLGDEKISQVKVTINQFYGIEINDFAVTVAKTALWIAESQMMKETEKILHIDLDFLPLKSYANIVEANALRIDWNDVVPKEKLNYIMGNPPFVGRRYRTDEQIKDVNNYFNYKDIDYVACWYKKAMQFIKSSQINVAFVSTNSIVQGEQVEPLWKEMFDNGIFINFAYQTFTWDSEANLKAHVFCIIVGFSMIKKEEKLIYASNGKIKRVNNINAYLLDAPNIIISHRSKPICNVPNMQNGNVPLDGDALKVEEKDLKYFEDCKYIKKLVGGRELLHNENRYVLWLVNVDPSEVKKMPKVLERVQKCKENRLKMKDKTSQKLAESPMTFRDTNNPKNYIAIPMVSSEKRRYIPIAYLDENTIPTNQIQMIQNATLYHFGILTSNVHMAWVRTVAGRLKSDYRYSKDIVYNNFIWPNPTERQKDKIEKKAKAILDARNLYPKSSLADLYDELTMPKELRQAHQENDKAVMEAYGFDWRNMTESDCVAKLMKMYQNKIRENC